MIPSSKAVLVLMSNASVLRLIFFTPEFTPNCVFPFTVTERFPTSAFVKRVRSPTVHSMEDTFTFTPRLSDFAFFKMILLFPISTFVPSVRLPPSTTISCVTLVNISMVKSPVMGPSTDAPHADVTDVTLPIVSNADPKSRALARLVEEVTRTSAETEILFIR